MEQPRVTPTPGWTSAANFAFVGPTTKWWIHGFIPEGELVMIHGFGSSGKSSFASYLASVVIQQGGAFGRIGTEEPFRRFFQRMILATNASSLRLYDLEEPLNIKLPLTGHAYDRLKGDIERLDLKVLYFDSVKDHFDHLPGLDAGDRARKCLSPLAALAVQTGCAIVCTFHDKKSGGYSGAAELENVARVRLEIQRKRGTDEPATLSVRKSNFKEPDYHLRLMGEERVVIDPRTREVQYEQGKDGTSAPQRLFCVTHRVEVPGQTLSSEAFAEAAKARNTTAKEKAAARGQEVRAYSILHPEATQQQLARIFNVSKKTIQNDLKGIVEEEEPPMDFGQFELLEKRQPIDYSNPADPLNLRHL